MKRSAGSISRRWNTADEYLPAKPSALLDRDQRSNRANQGEMEGPGPLLGRAPRGLYKIQVRVPAGRPDRSRQPLPRLPGAWSLAFPVVEARASTSP